MKRTPTQYEKTSAKRIRQLIDDYCDGKQIVFAEKIGIGKDIIKSITDVFGER